MKRTLDYANSVEYYLSNDALSHSETKIDLLNRTQVLLDRLMRMCRAYDVFYTGSISAIAYWRGCTGYQGLGLGTLDPDPISDLTVGGVRRGKLIQKPDIGCWEGLLYGYDERKRLRVVEHGSSLNLNQITFVSYQEKQVIGFRYNVRTKAPEGIFVCDYGEDKRILRYSNMYIQVNYRDPERSEVRELCDARYGYENDLLTTADERRVFYSEPPMPLFSFSRPDYSSDEHCLMKRRVYTFQIDEKKYYVSWRCRDYDGDREVGDGWENKPVAIRKRSRAHSTLHFIDE